MNIIPADVSDARVLRLFSEHDDFMVEFLGEDRVYYTRYSDEEKLERVWLACEDGKPVGCVAYRKKVR